MDQEGKGNTIVCYQAENPKIWKQSPFAVRAWVTPKVYTHESVTVHTTITFILAPRLDNVESESLITVSTISIISSVLSIGLGVLCFCYYNNIKMSAMKTYFLQEMKRSMLTLEHHNPTDFYLSSWQTTRSVVPLLIWRALLFLTSLGIVLTSVIIYILNGKFAYWFIYLTHWGLTSILLATGFATLVSARCYLYGPISTEFRLPWYVKTYWTLFNIAVPFAFLITIFYWTVLYEAGIEEELNHGLDVAVHGLNSLVMLLILISSAHPVRLLHIYQPLVFGAVYLLFSVIYHFAGGTDQKGNAYIYPVVNWSEPSTTILVVLVTGLLLANLHLVTLGLSAARDSVASRCVRSSVTVRADEGMPLRQPGRMNA